MNFMGSMTGLNLPGMSPFGGGEKKSFFQEGLAGAWSPMPGFQPFSPTNPTSFFNPGGATESATGGGFSSFYNDMFQFENDLDDAESNIDEWEDGWGMDPDEDLDKQAGTVFRENGVEAENRLTRIYKARDNLRRMRTRFGGVEVTTDRPVRHGRTSQGGIRVDTGKTTKRLNGIQINIDSNAARTDRSPSSDRERFPEGRVQELQGDLASSTETLADLNRQIADLKSRLPPPDKRITVAGEASDKPPGTSEDSDSDKGLKGLSGLRQMVLEVRRMNQAQAQRKQVSFPSPPDEWVSKGNDKRYWGEYDKEGRTTNVLIEWKSINAANPPPPHTTFTFKNMVRVKIESLTSLLKIPENVRPAGLRMLNCLGVFRRSNDDEVAYGLVFETPSKKHQSLIEILRRDAGFAKQSNLMIMARALSKAVLYLHLARWLHKGIRSNNIILFPKEDGTIDFSQPYVIGYEYTRQAGKVSLTEVVEDDFVSNLYRHPRMQGLPQDQSSSMSGSGIRDESPTKKSRPDFNGGGADSPPVGSLSRQDSWSVPAPLVVRRDRSSSNPSAPPLLIRRDSSANRISHRRGESSIDRPDFLRRDSDRERSPFQSFHDIYALGIVLLEIGLREPIKSVYDRAMRDPIYGKHFAEKFRQWMLANEVPRLGVMVGDKYQEVVAVCLDDTLEGMSDQELQKEFYSKVVRVLANITAHL